MIDAGTPIKVKLSSAKSFSCPCRFLLANLPGLHYGLPRNKNVYKKPRFLTFPNLFLQAPDSRILASDEGPGHCGGAGTEKL
ncbi:hypothetical protein CFP56_042463 [Quercus suber]|uniref:Uncharacterized protein n=1 Tax=Quercus suber TaxID=58331 RepID=A0AAW0ITS9_QUESU